MPRNHPRPRRSSARWLEGAPTDVLACYDSGPRRGADRYTVLYGGRQWCPDYAEANRRAGRDPRLLPARAMSENPFHPQGIGLYVEALRGPHLGRKVRFSDLPDLCRACVEQDCREDGEGEQLPLPLH